MSIETHCRWINLTPHYASSKSFLPRWGHTALFYEPHDAIYIFGGVCESEKRGTRKLRSRQLTVSRVFKYSFAEQAWIGPVDCRGDIPLNRLNHSACIYKNFMVIYGGCLSERESFWNYDSIIQLDLDSFIWKEIDARGTDPAGKNGHSCVVFKDSMYIFGGSPFQPNGFYQFDFILKKWKHLKFKGTPKPRIHHSAFVYKNRMYIAGGTNRTTLFFDIHYFDFDSSTWTCVTSDGFISTQNGVVVHDNLISIHQGYEIFSFDLLSERWSTLTSSGMDVKRFEYSVTPRGDKLYLFGGFSTNGNVANKVVLGELFQLELQLHGMKNIIKDEYKKFGDVLFAFREPSSHGRKYIKLSI